MSASPRRRVSAACPYCTRADVPLAVAADVVHAVEVELDDDDDDDDDSDGAAPPPAPPVLCYCERPAALLDGRWVCAQLVEGDFCILGREDE